MSNFIKILEKLNEAEVKMPRTLYKSEIRKFFGDNYEAVAELFDTNREEATVQGDDGEWYDLKVKSGTWHDKKLSIKKGKKP